MLKENKTHQLELRMEFCSSWTLLESFSVKSRPSWSTRTECIMMSLMSVYNCDLSKTCCLELTFLSQLQIQSTKLDMKMYNQDNIKDVSTSSIGSLYSYSSTYFSQEYLVDDDWLFLGEEPPVTSVPVRLHITNLPFRYR